jgi:Fe2+ or Zn2+ uptake regulation protein
MSRTPLHAEVITTAPASAEEAVALLRQRGSRATPSRRFLLEALYATDQHLTADELAAGVHERSPEVHLSTIYRNLDELQRLGLVTHTHLGHGPVTYQLASHAHAHLICNTCGHRVEAPDGLFVELEARALADHGFRVDPHHLAVFGTCADCQSG